MDKIVSAVNRLKNSKGLIKLLALFCGALLFALPFMAEELWFFGWIGLSLLFVIIMDFQKTTRRVFGSLFCFFFMFYVFAYSWFVSMYPLDFAGLGTAESIGVIICAEILIPIIHSCLMTMGVLLGYLAAKRTKNVFFEAVLVSCGYVLGELLQSLGTLAFPWAMLFVGQSAIIEILQSASLFGARFITFIMVFVNALIALLLLNLKDTKKSKTLGIVALCVFLLNFGFGAVRLAVTDYDKSETVTAIAFQGNIPSSEKWKPGRKAAIDVYYDLALEAKEYCDKNGIDADVAAIPETAFPYTINPDNADSEAVTVSSEMAQLFGADVFIGAFSENGEDSYNSLFVFYPDGSVNGKTYNKRNLVPFGEFLPYRAILTKIMPSLAEINMLSHDLSKGENPKPLKASYGNAACLVCFDSIFSENARTQVKQGADYIVISTNDSWYKQSKALYQHSSHAVMRAIENGRSVLRSANTGISMIIDPVGRVKSKTAVDERTFIVDEMPVEKGMTLYTFTGDLVAPVSFLLVLGVLVYSFIKKKILPR